MAIRNPLKKITRMPVSGNSTVKTSVRKISSITGKNQKTPTPTVGTARGPDGFSRAREQQIRQQEDYDRKKEKPFPFRITQKDMKEKRNVVDMLYLDKEPFFVRLHTVPNGHGGFDDEVCLADTGGICPLCQQLGKEGTWTLVLTALDKRPYRNRDGVLTKQSKKLVMVKSRNIDKFERQYQKHHTFRGLVCTHRRHAPKEASIGEDLEFKDKLVPEVVIAKSGDLSKVTDYAKAFAALSQEAMASKYANIDTSHDSGFGGGRKTVSHDDEDAPSW